MLKYVDALEAAIPTDGVDEGPKTEAEQRDAVVCKQLLIDRGQWGGLYESQRAGLDEWIAQRVDHIGSEDDGCSLGNDGPVWTAKRRDGNKAMRGRTKRPIPGASGRAGGGSLSSTRGNRNGQDAEAGPRGKVNPSW